MANDELEMMEAWNASRPNLLDKALGLSDQDHYSIPTVYESAWRAARKNRYALPAAKARAEIAVRKFINTHQPKATLGL